MTTMNAICIHQFGGPEVLTYEELPRPVPGEGELLIRVHAAGTNPVDWKTRTGATPFDRSIDRFPLILGWDLAGVVEQVGQGARGFSAGDPVYGMVRFPEPGGTYAEYVAAPAAHVLPKPASVDFVEAAALPLVSLTAWQALFEAGGLAAGQTVLIHGAAGGVGHVAVQLARWRGARVIGTARAHHEEFLRGLGVDQVIDYQTTRFEEVVHDLDLVMESAGGDVAERSLDVLRQGGTLVSLRTTPGLADKAAARGVRWQRILVRPEPGHFAAISRLVESGQLRPTVSAVLDLQEANKAHESLERGHTRGKIVLQVRTP